MESSGRQRRCGRVQRSNYPDWFYRRRSWRRMVHAICNCSQEDERCRSACERDRHALRRTGCYRSPSFGGSAAGAWRICSLAVVAESSIRRLALSWLFMKYFHLWFSFPTFWTAIVFVVPGLEVANRVRVSRDLDRKIERLSSGWITALTAFQSQTQAASDRRN